ncbi:hypothetical protein TK0869 [Thermococcus kodakarensis KOD1]|uniref:Uncharacterized protein n=1 Tax=Thermococcus kodakarensis (strain ATCC BAA-918 / JCM 12380 / KOD1) TaxID=69014 RepID=Q5JI18_THEKO|nr:hypothetical protein TK0869 [Thermococcus kodakarensis KOD1]
MKSRRWEVEVNVDWDVLKTILSEPKKTLLFFPYFKEFDGQKVRFEVPRFIFNFGYEFELDVGFGNSEAIYTFRGERGILTVTFKVQNGRLKVTADWAGFGEALMGKPLEIFASGIAEAVQEFCTSLKCPVVKVSEEGGEVTRITPDSAPALLKRLALEFGTSFMVEGTADDGTYLAAKVVNGKLVELRLKQGTRESVISTDVSVVELDEGLFEDLPLDRSFKIKVRELTP